MSQAGMNNTSSGPLPPTVPLIFETDQPVGTGTVSATNNIIQILGGYTSDNNVNGIETYANPTGSTGSNNIVIDLTNRFQVSGTISDLGLHIIYAQSLGAIARSYLFQFTLVLFNSTSGLSSGYVINKLIRTDGAAATNITPTDVYEVPEGTMFNVAVGTGAAANSFVVEITGYAIGPTTQTIRYNLTGTYTQV